ncbi:MAG: RHS repeat-associated core domain-containing protein [Archangium sp.]|nr:RHS repeat-associated core domain-containing protein [Archangium sp.]
MTDVDEVAALDEYVYLGGMPVISILGQLSQATRTRMSDFSTGWCIRRGVERQCGMHQIVSDYQGTPIVVFNQKNRVTGVGEYDLFGHRNRISLPAVESSHPASTEQIMASQIGRANAEIQTFVRLRVSYLDSSPVGWFDTPPQVAIRGTGSSTTLSTAIGVFPSVVTQFHPGTMFDAVFVPGTTTSRGAALDSYEFERATAHSSVARYFPPLRFPGQYYDEETDFHENWNRFYDPTTGRYLSPEPMLQSPLFLLGVGQRGSSSPAYAYASNNSVNYTDSTGLFFSEVSWEQNWALEDAKLDPNLKPGIEALEVSPQEIQFSRASCLKSLNSGGGNSYLGHSGRWQLSVNEYVADWIIRNDFGFEQSLEMALAHELGHIHASMFEGLRDARNPMRALDWENSVRLRHGGPLRRSELSPKALNSCVPVPPCP